MQRDRPWSGVAGLGPEVDAGLGGVAVDLGQLVVGEVEVVEAATLSSSWATLEAPSRAEVTRGSRRAQATASWARLWSRRRAATSLEARTLARVSSLSWSRSMLPGLLARSPRGCRPGSGRSAPWARGEDDAAGPLVAQHLQQAVVLDPAVQHRVRRLVDEQGGAEAAQDLGRLAGPLRRVGGDAGVQRLALADVVSRAPIVSSRGVSGSTRWE